ncbi:hypothetical protein [Picrophilus oshimae]|uniref:hypothetical protein n=1 Tax=Picrophilus oshimae TaxID=46632 RepID=UPI00064F6007|nr:hypothetical protein [Picrophilus oshimae]
MSVRTDIENLKKQKESLEDFISKLNDAMEDAVTSINDKTDDLELNDDDEQILTEVSLLSEAVEVDMMHLLRDLEELVQGMDDMDKKFKLSK